MYAVRDVSEVESDLDCNKATFDIKIYRKRFNRGFVGKLCITWGVGKGAIKTHIKYSGFTMEGIKAASDVYRNDLRQRVMAIDKLVNSTIK